MDFKRHLRYYTTTTPILGRFPEKEPYKAVWCKNRISGWCSRYTEPKYDKGRYTVETWCTCLFYLGYRESMIDKGNGCGTKQRVAAIACFYNTINEVPVAMNAQPIRLLAVNNSCRMKKARLLTSALPQKPCVCSLLSAQFPPHSVSAPMPSPRITAPSISLGKCT